MTQTPRQIHFHLIPIRRGEYKAALCWCAAAAVSAQLDDVSFLSFVWGILFCCTMSCQLNRLLLIHLSWGSFPKWQEEKSDKANRRCLCVAVEVLDSAVHREDVLIIRCLWAGCTLRDGVWACIFGEARVNTWTSQESCVKHERSHSSGIEDSDDVQVVVVDICLQKLWFFKAVFTHSSCMDPNVCVSLLGPSLWLT